MLAMMTVLPGTAVAGRWSTVRSYPLAGNVGLNPAVQHLAAMMSVAVGLLSVVDVCVTRLT